MKKIVLLTLAMIAHTAISQVGSTASDTCKVFTLSRAEVDALNKFRIDDLAKNKIIESLLEYVKDDAVLIDLLRKDLSITKTNFQTAEEKNDFLYRQNEKARKKVRRTRIIGITSTAVAFIISSVFIILH